MKSDLDGLMRDRGLDAVLIWVDELYSPPFDYLTGGAHVTRGVLIKQPGLAPVLYASSMETEEAAKSGLETHIYNGPELRAYWDQTHDMSRATALWWGEILSRCGLNTGTVGVYGMGDLAFILRRGEELKDLCSAYTFVGEPFMERPLFAAAYATKDADEVARLRRAARRTDGVLQAAWDYIAGHRLDGDRVVDAAGTPLTIGMVKRFVRKALLDVEMEDTGMIFAQGRDAGFPHSRGEADEVLRAGQSIVFDLFPREMGGGYYHDVTRTWSIGYATPEVQDAYNQVMEAFDIAVETARAGAEARLPQEAVLAYFESKGHQTIRTSPGTQEGYVHSLGHGIGLNIHEAPGMSHQSSDVLQVGNAITIEPGLYYPERGYGVRIEDSCVIDANGQIEALTQFRKDLVLPLHGG